MGNPQTFDIVDQPTGERADDQGGGLTHDPRKKHAGWEGTGGIDNVYIKVASRRIFAAKVKPMLNIGRCGVSQGKGGIILCRGESSGRWKKTR